MSRSKPPITGNEWFEEEIELLKDKYPVLNRQELLPLFPRHTLSSIAKKAFNLGLKRKTGLTITSLIRKTQYHVIGPGL